jgi:hypothetical protein
VFSKDMYSWRIPNLRVDLTKTITFHLNNLRIKTVLYSLFKAYQTEGFVQKVPSVKKSRLSV